MFVCCFWWRNDGFGKEIFFCWYSIIKIMIYVTVRVGLCIGAKRCGFRILNIFWINSVEKRFNFFLKKLKISICKKNICKKVFKIILFMGWRYYFWVGCGYSVFFMIEIIFCVYVMVYGYLFNRKRKKDFKCMMIFFVEFFNIYDVKKC